MIVLDVEKILVERFVNALTAGGKIDAPPEKWSSNELLNLAGAALAVRDRQNSQQLPTHGQQRQQSSAEPDSFAEHQFNRDLVTALGIVRELANNAHDDWGDYWGPTVSALVDHIRLGEHGVKYIRGILVSGVDCSK
jgi:hypothetical protein